MSERVSKFRQHDGFIYLGGLSIGESVVPPTDLLTFAAGSLDGDRDRRYR